MKKKNVRLQHVLLDPATIYTVEPASGCYFNVSRVRSS
jgi:hypothetical protein